MHQELRNTLQFMRAIADPDKPDQKEKDDSFAVKEIVLQNLTLKRKSSLHIKSLELGEKDQKLLELDFVSKWYKLMVRGGSCVIPVLLIVT